MYLSYSVKGETCLLKHLPQKLPDQDDQQVTTLLQKNGIISMFATEVVKDVDIRRLLPRQWLNDEIINFYGAMIQARSEGNKENTTKGKGKPFLSIHYFSTFFWSKLKRDGYIKGGLHKWTKEVSACGYWPVTLLFDTQIQFDLFSKDAILIPVNHANSHWTAASINFRQKRLESYDSLFIYNDDVLLVSSITSCTKIL